MASHHQLGSITSMQAAASPQNCLHHTGTSFWCAGNVDEAGYLFSGQAGLQVRQLEACCNHSTCKSRTGLSTGCQLGRAASADSLGSGLLGPALWYGALKAGRLG
jgi:hypothetical protein